MRKLLIIVTLLLSSLSLSATIKIGYLPTGYGTLFTSPSNIPFKKLTHINLSFLNPSNNMGDIQLGNISYLNDFVTKAHSENVQVYISVAGAINNGTPTFNNLKAIISSDTKRAIFEDNIINFIQTYNLDGLDIDIETGLLEDLCKSGHYQKLISELRVKIGSKGFTVALPAGGFADFVPASTIKLFDWVNIMAYDNYGTWTGKGQHSSIDDYFDAIDYYLFTVGLSKDKIVPGVPFYGYGWGSSTTPISFRELIALSTSTANVNYYNDASNNMEYYYNGRPTMQEKVDEVAAQGYKGIMFWELNQDAAAPYSLLDIVNNTIATSIEDNIITNSSVKVYPNPAKSKIYIADSKATHAVIQNIEGLTVLTTTFSESSPEINIETLPSGFYILKLYEEKGIIVKKIIKE